MAEKPIVYDDHESGRSPSGEETKLGDTAYGGLPPDPDEGLSEEEKAKIVSRRSLDISANAKVDKDRALLWRLDLKLIPWLCLLYLISFLDSTMFAPTTLQHTSDKITHHRDKCWKRETCWANYRPAP